MKMREIIDHVSEFYRAERGKVADLQDELRDINRQLVKAEEEDFENISYAEYSRLISKSMNLKQEIELKTQHYEGISCVRELLMSLGFDTKVDIK